MSEVTYRQARPNDVSRIAELIEAAGLPARQIEEFIDGFILAEREGDVIACGGLEVYGDTAMLRSLVVDPSAQKLGIGRELVDQLMAAAAKSGVKDVYLFTGRAHSFWERLGFTDVAMDEWRAPARSGWQYKRVTENWERFQAMGIRSMWKNADRRRVS